MLRGEQMLAGCIAINPDNEIARRMQLLANLDDPSRLERYREFEDWFKHTQAIPRRFLSLDRRAPLPRQRADPWRAHRRG